MYTNTKKRVRNLRKRVSKRYMVPGAGIEPARCITPRDFKSLASTYSATRAMDADVQVLLSVFPLSVNKQAGFAPVAPKGSGAAQVRIQSPAPFENAAGQSREKACMTAWHLQAVLNRKSPDLARTWSNPSNRVAD